MQVSEFTKEHLDNDRIDYMIRLRRKQQALKLKDYEKHNHYCLTLQLHKQQIKVAKLILKIL